MGPGPLGTRARHTVAAGSAELGAACSDDPAGLNRLKVLARTGSADAISDGRVSRYGKQTGDTHGGLLFSRTPYTLFHSAPGQFRDVDLSSCYPAIIGPMVVYMGRPLVLEPGNEELTLREGGELPRATRRWSVRLVREGERPDSRVREHADSIYSERTDQRQLS